MLYGESECCRHADADSPEASTMLCYACILISYIIMPLGRLARIVPIVPPQEFPRKSANQRGTPDYPHSPSIVPRSSPHLFSLLLLFSCSPLSPSLIPNRYLRHDQSQALRRRRRPT